MTITLRDMHRTGVFNEHRGRKMTQGTHTGVRLTIPAREALEVAGAIITLDPNDGGPRRYTIKLVDRCPPDLVAVSIVGDAGPTGIRRSDEPGYPGEAQPDYWLSLDLTPCPKCGAPLVWYEAGYVPGYRVCAGRRHHHWMAE